MKLPDEQTWLRVEALADELATLPQEEAAAAMLRLREAGEPATILSFVGNWLALPPPTSGLEPGCVLGNRYKLLEKLGEGAMGCVWRARQELIGREVALKAIHPALVTPALESRFVNEIGLLGRLVHVGIVRIYDAGFHERPNLPALPFFTMELIEGLPLSSWSRIHRSETASLLQLMSKVCDALQFAHERQIVHRDLKPANILVKQDGTPVVVDFGIAGLAGIGAGRDAELFSGTPQYAPPEQHLGRDWDFRTGESVDVYAIGAILFEILAGRRMFEFGPGTSLGEMRRRILEEPRPLLAECLKDCPPMLNELVGRATRRDPADRYYSIGALGRALLRAAEAYSPRPIKKAAWVPQAAGVVPGSQWRLETKIGEGGAGEVWSATHEDLQQRAVFKFCDSEEKARTLKRELTFFRLLKERIGRNSHFIQLEDVSLDEPPYFLRMAYSEARELEVWCKSQPGGLCALDEAVRVEIIAQTAEALQAAHEAGILHRDIKPSNLLIESNDSPARLHVLVADFGIGQLLTDQLIRDGTRLGFTRTVEDLRTTLAGTMLYLAPEVLEGNGATVRSDIYSIGVLFWQLLVGNLKMALDPSDWASRIQDPLLREDLRRCLAGNPAERWASAGELANSLRALPERRAAAIRRQAELEMRERAAYRNGVLRTATAAFILVVLLGSLAWLAWTKSQEAKKERNALTVSKMRNALEEIKTRLELKDGSANALLTRERPTLDLTDPNVKSEWRNVACAILALPTFSPVKLPFELSDKDSFAEEGDRLIMLDSSGAPKALDLSVSPPNVTNLSSAGGITNLRINAFGLAAGGLGADGNLRLWHGNNFSECTCINGPIHGGCFALSPSNLGASRAVAVAVARPDGAIDVELLGKTNAAAHLFRDISETAVNFPLSCPATMMAFSLTRETILAAAGPTSGTLLFWRISNDPAAPLQGELASSAWHPDVITSLAWNPSEDEIATGCLDGSVRFWPFTPTGNVIQTRPSRSAETGEPIRDIAWSSSGELIAVLSESGNIQVLRSKKPNQRMLAQMRLPGARHIAFAFGGTLVAWGTNVSAAWGNEQSPIFSERRISGHEVYACFHQDGCLTAATIERVHFLNPNTLARTASFKATPVGAGHWRGDIFYYPQSDEWKSVLLSRTSDAPFLKLSGGPGTVEGVIQTWPSPSGNRTARFDREHFLTMCEGQPEETPLPMAVKPQIVAVSDNSPIAAWREERLTLKICESAGTNVQTETIQDGILDLAFAPKQNVLAVRTGSAVLLIALDSKTRCRHTIAAPAQSYSPVAFSPDGHWLAVCGADDSICLAPVRSELQALASGSGSGENIFAGALRLASPERRGIITLCWNAKGDRLAAGSAEGFVNCWNVSLLRRQLRLWNLDRDDEILPEEPRFLAIKLN